MVKTIGNVQKDAQVRAVASGTLSNGDTVIVNSDGTVSAISGSDAATGSEATFESDYVTWTSCAYDTNAQKVVVAYQDNNGGTGNAVVGTVSGTSISFGTPVVFENATTTYVEAIYDTNAQKVVIAYRDGGNVNAGTAIVGTVNGTSISFGSPTVFESVNSTYIGITYDSNAQKVVVSYRDNGNSDYGTAAVGTVSGTSISFGTPVVFESAATEYTAITYDSDQQKVVIAYRDMGNSNLGTAIVGTVSGTSISFGSPTVFHSSGSSRYITATYDTVAQKTVIFFQDDGNSFYGTAVVGTVSGTSISFGTAAVFNSAGTTWKHSVYDSSSSKVVCVYPDGGNNGVVTMVKGTVSGTSISFDDEVVIGAKGIYIGAAYDPEGKKLIASYRGELNSNYGTSVVRAFASTNLTSDNFIGFANGAYADTQSAVINTTCTVDRNQTSLTAGQKYYVQTDGALGLTPADPSVEAGTAISSTEILVKG